MTLNGKNGNDKVICSHFAFSILYHPMDRGTTSATQRAVVAALRLKKQFYRIPILLKMIIKG